MATKSRKTTCFRITVPVTDGVSMKAWKEYLENAAKGWKGGLNPEDPLFDMDRDKIRVVRDYRYRSTDK
jgi:hypothetical protein